MKKTIIILLLLSFIFVSCISKEGCQTGPRIKTEMGTIKKH